MKVDKLAYINVEIFKEGYLCDLSLIMQYFLSSSALFTSEHLQHLLSESIVFNRMQCTLGNLTIVWISCDFALQSLRPPLDLGSFLLDAIFFSLAKKTKELYKS